MGSKPDIEESVEKTRQGFLRHAAEEGHEGVPLRRFAAEVSPSARRDAQAPEAASPATVAAGLHPFFRGLLDSLPEPGSEWAPAQREQWLETARNIFALIYTEARRQRAPAEAREPIQIADAQRQQQPPVEQQRAPVEQQRAPAEQQYEERSA